MPGLDSLNPISQAAGVGLGIGELVSGSINLNKDKAAEDALHAPFYKIQNEYYQNKNLAESMAAGGIPQATKDYETTQRIRGFASGLKALQEGGADPNAFAKLFDTYNNSISTESAQDAEAHLRNIQYYMGANKDLAGQKTTAWAINEKQPYERKLKELKDKIEADKAMQWGGVETAIGAGSAAGTAQQNANLGKGGNGDFFSKIFGNSDPFTPTTQATNLPINTSLAIPQGGPSITL